MKDIQIGKFSIGPGQPPFILAELSANHNGSLDRALEIVEAAAKAGCHGLKLQTYTADTITLDIREGDFVVNDEGSPWKGRQLYELYQEAYTPWEWHARIMERARELGMVAFSSPFDDTSVDFLETLDVPAYKIASIENTDWPLLKKVAATGKPVIMSTGTATLEDLAGAVRTLRKAGCEDIILLKCTSAYPTTPEAAHLRSIPFLEETFDLPIGLSDHTMGIGVAVASVALGSCLIEKHLTLRRADGGVDSLFSMEPEEMAQLVEESHKAFLALGDAQQAVLDSEAASVRLKRSIYVAKDILAGEVFDKENLRVVRPGAGLPPKYYELLLGRTARQDLKRGTPMQWDLLL